MLSLFDEELLRIDKQMASAKPDAIPELFEPIPLDIFGQLLLDIPATYPNCRAFFPSMAPEKVQQDWTGSHGITLLKQSLAFVKTLVSGYQSLTGQKLREAAILDYGCGWGRLLRVLYKLTPIQRLCGVDPWDKSIELCHQHGIKAQLAISDWVPRQLPFDRRFELIFAFSVFTHLSEKTARIVLATLRNHIASGGVLAITIRPKEYWHHHDQGRHAAEMIQQHETKGYAFLPHNRPPIDGDITYGDASFSIPYLQTMLNGWRIAMIDYNLADPLQVVLFLVPA
jgi:2-polyprenyl-3-methyl-5-hydroxy-6-metoxy-1,4-benzoquinol methylase